MYYIYYPGYIFIALACFSFAATILISVWSKKFKKIAAALFLSTFVLFTIGFFMAETSSFSLD